MTKNEDFVTVSKRHFKLFLHHCRHCPSFSEQWSLDEHQVLIPGRHLPDEPASNPPDEPASKKRKRLPLGLSEGTAKRPAKDEATDSFLRNVPRASEWRKRQVEVGLHTVEQYEKVIQAFIRRSNVDVKKEPSQEDSHSENELVNLAKRYALLTKASLAAAGFQRSFSNFQALILLSFCRVLEKRMVPYETVDEITQYIYITKSREQDRRRLRDSAEWINGIIASLIKRGWSIYQATELFFINSLSPTYLINIRYNENRKFILEHLEKEEFVNSDFSDCLRPEYSIPGLIASLLDTSDIQNPADRLSIYEICTALGYDPAGVPKSVERIHKVCPAEESSSVASGSFDFHVMVPDSFRSQNTPLTKAAHRSRSPQVQALNSRSPARDAGSSSPHSLSFASTPSTTQSHSIDSTLSTTEIQQSPASNHINYEAFEQPVASAQDPNRSYNIQPETNQWDQELSTGLQLRQSHQQSEELIPYSTPVDTSALEAPRFGGSAGNPGPQLQLPTQMKVPDTAQSIRFAMNGDIDGLKYLFRQGLASPRDVSYSRGFSLVRWALYGGMHNYKTVQFLLSWGASVDEDSYQHAWDYAYRKKCSITELAELECITFSTYRDWVEEQQFPLIHNIILGRSTKPLRAELDDNPDAVRVTDAMGRTALDWATALAQLSDMRLLIDRGSPLNTMDFGGRTTVLHAVDSHNDDALRIVLEAGANPNPEVPKGLFRSSPLTAASFGGLVGMVKLLIKFGAKVDAYNPEGRTALQAAASMQNVECADILLTNGADLGYISSNGHSPLTTAIIYNNHDVLKLFIDRCDTSRLKGLQLLPILAESADAETMSILASSDLLKQTLLNQDGFAAGRETLRSRTDYDEELGNVFEELFFVARANEEAAAFRTAASGIVI